MVNKMKEDFERELDEIMRTGKKFAIWGAGSEGVLSTDYIKKYCQDRIRPEFYIDNNPATWGHNNCIRPDEFVKVMDKIEVLFICVYVADQVEKQVRGQGFAGTTLSIISTILNCHLFGQVYEDNPEEVKALRKCLSDERSRDTLSAFTAVYKSGDISLWKDVNADSTEKCLSNEILKISDTERFVDIGAFTGDTVEKFLENSKGKYSKILAIEPDPGSFRLLEKNIAKIENAKALQVAVGKENGKIGFSEGFSEGSRLSKDGKSIKLVCLDDLEEAQDATLIKISTNGYEFPVFEGAMDLIKKQTPKLSYYCWGALAWKIPVLIKSLVPEYKFYLRHYGLGLQGMIGYAVKE